MTLKRVNPKQILYHYFERTSSDFVLYDDELDMPIAYGSRNLVDTAVRKLKQTVTIVYYKKDLTDKSSFKKKIIYDGKKKADLSKILENN